MVKRHVSIMPFISKPTASQSGPTASIILDQLVVLCQRHPIARKMVFVPYRQLGRALETALARVNGSWGGLECMTVAAYAKSLAERAPADVGSTCLTSYAQHMLVRSIAGELNTHAASEVDLRRLTAEWVDTIQVLRAADVSAAQVERRVSNDSEQSALLVQLYSRYEAHLKQHKLHDEADLFDEALRTVEMEEACVDNTVLAICPETELHARSVRLLEALEQRCEAFYRFQYPVADEAEDEKGKDSSSAWSPQTSAAQVMSGLLQPIPEPERVEDPPSKSAAEKNEAGHSSDITVRMAVGPTREVRHVLRDILRAGTPLDDVEIAYTASDPYLGLISSEAKRAGVPITLGPGLPLTRTRPGQALAGLYEWIEDGFQPAPLIRLLRGGLLCVDRWLAQHGLTGLVQPHEVATTLAGHRYPPGRDGYDTVLTAAIEKGLQDDGAGEEGRSVADTPIETLTQSARWADGGLSRDVRRLFITRALTRELLALIPECPSPSQLAQASQSFLDVFGPRIYEASSEEHPEQDKPEKTIDQIGQTVIQERLLAGLNDLPVEAPESASDLARFFREMIGRQYAGAQQPVRGAAHVLPLESAGFTGRSMLYVLGADSETTAVLPSINPVLQDADRERLDPDKDGCLPRSHDQPRDMAWRYDAALHRHQGPIMFTMTCFDPRDGEERFPSSLLLKWAEGAVNEDKHANKRETLCPAGPPFLTASEAWLAASVTGYDHGDGASAHLATDSTARQQLHEEYPWIRDGDQARVRRAATTYTEHDGLLSPGDYSELDFLDPAYDGPPLSAGRLQTFAESPYAYFIKYILGVKPLDEPALDGERWLTPLRKGDILHHTFDAFTQVHSGESIPPVSELYALLDREIDRAAKTVYPGNAAALAQMKERLRRAADLFYASVESQDDAIETVLSEWGFGITRYQQDGDIGAFRLRLGTGDQLPVRGRIDRVDWDSDAEQFIVWDYKTGSQSSFSRTDPLKGGEKLQWALYARVLEQHKKKPVRTSGYHFLSEKEFGTKLVFELDDDSRRELDAIIQNLAGLSRTGTFPMHEKAKDKSPWKWGDYDQLFRDLDGRCEQLGVKKYPEARPAPRSWADS